MMILNPDHLFGQAERLVAPPPAGRPRQVDIRRAISGAYYGLFHHAMASAADEFVGATQRSTSRYALVYRSVDHQTLKRLCIEVMRQKPSPKYIRHVPASGFSVDIDVYATAMLELQERRLEADYDPALRFRTFDAHIAIGTARKAVQHFRQASQEHRRAFLTLLLCPPR